MNIKLLRENAKIPTKGSELAAGYDLYAANEDIIYILPGDTAMVPTGLAIEIGEEGWFGGIFSRSGLATKMGLRPANCVGVIDADYRGEIYVALYNDSEMRRKVLPGDRIAQLIFLPYGEVDRWNVVEELDNTDRGSGGFGSTGA